MTNMTRAVRAWKVVVGDVRARINIAAAQRYLA